MSATQISPIAAAQHYKDAADFWQDQAKLLRHHLNEAQQRLAEMEQQIEAARETAAEGRAAS